MTRDELEARWRAQHLGHENCRCVVLASASTPEPPCDFNVVSGAALDRARGGKVETWLKDEWRVGKCDRCGAAWTGGKRPAACKQTTGTSPTD